MERGRQARRLERELPVQVELQWQAQKILFDIAADLFDQAQCLAVAAEQQVLAVVELGVVVQHAARAAAELSGALEHGDRNAACGEFDCGCHARIAAADDGRVQRLGEGCSCYSLTLALSQGRGAFAPSPLGEGWDEGVTFSSSAMS